jgi:hypothetical protein
MKTTDDDPFIKQKKAIECGMVLMMKWIKR